MHASAAEAEENVRRAAAGPTKFRIRIIVEPDGDEFHAYCPALKGLHTSGPTEEESPQNATDAAAAYLASLAKHGDPINEETGSQDKKPGFVSPTPLPRHRPLATGYSSLLTPHLPFQPPLATIVTRGSLCTDVTGATLAAVDSRCLS